MNGPTPRYHEAVRTFKKHFLRTMLVAHGGNRTLTAQALGVQRTYLVRLIRDLGLNVPRACFARQTPAELSEIYTPCGTGSRSSASR